MLHRRIIATFSNIKKHYDLISVGAYANKSAKLVQLISKHPFKVLAVTPNVTQVEPSLAPKIVPPLLQLTQRNQRFADIEQGVNVDQIFPEQNRVLLTNGQSYTYSSLIYSGSPNEWKDTEYYPGAQQHAKMSNSFLCTDSQYTNLGQIYRQRIGKIVVTLPKNKNLSYENLFMFQLLRKIEREQKNWQKQMNSLKVMIVNEGDSIDPFNQVANEYLQTLIKRYKIEYLKYANFEVDYWRRNIKIDGYPQQVLYSFLFHYLPYKIPKPLYKSGFELQEFSRQTTLHHHFPNISLISSIQKTAPSIKATEQELTVAAHNIYYQLMGMDKAKKVQSSLFTQYDIWLDENRLFRIAYDKNEYRGDHLDSKVQTKGLGLNGRQNIMSYGRGFLKKHMTWYDTINIVNGDHNSSSNKPNVINLKEEAAKKLKL